MSLINATELEQPAKTSPLLLRFEKSLMTDKNHTAGAVMHEGDDAMLMDLDELINSYNSGTVLTLIVLIVGLAANAALLWSLLTNTDKRSRLRPFLINLAIADLLVCCFTIAMELGWRLTVVWTAGDAGCRFFSFMKTLGLYVEAFVVLSMSIDRCYVVLWPMRISGQARRTRLYLAAAWVAAVIFSIPQAIVFHIEEHPEAPEFVQCVTLNSFSSPAAEKAYVIMGILAMYVIPLIIIIIVSTILLWTIRSATNCRGSFGRPTKPTFTFEAVVDQANSKKPKRENHLKSCRETELSLREPVDQEQLHVQPLRGRLHTGLQLCHADTIIRKKARSRTLKLSMLVVLAFILCYTPYAVMISIAFINSSDVQPPSEEMSVLTEALLVLSLSFSTIMNPLVYGSYMLYSRKRWEHFLKCLCRTGDSI